MENLSKTKKKKTHEDIEFHNSIQDWVFTTVYQLYKVLGKMPVSKLFDVAVGEN